MSDLTRKRTGWLVALGVFVIGLFVLIAASIDLAGAGLVSHAKAAPGEEGASGDGHAKPAVAPAPAQAQDAPAAADAKKKDPDAALRGLSCFGCHDLKAYHEGNKTKKRAASEDDDDDSVIGKPFSHDFHAEEVGGHCHKCHAFKGHFEVVVREETCGECH